MMLSKERGLRKEDKWKIMENKTELGEQQLKDT